MVLLLISGRGKKRKIIRSDNRKASIDREVDIGDRLGCLVLIQNPYVIKPEEFGYTEKPDYILVETVDNWEKSTCEEVQRSLLCLKGRFPAVMEIIWIVTRRMGKCVSAMDNTITRLEVKYSGYAEDNPVIMKHINRLITPRKIVEEPGRKWE